MMKTGKLTYISLLCTLALIFGYIESLFPLPVPIPGIKPGLSNIVIMFALFRLGKSDAFFIMLIKVLLSSVLFGGLNTLFYSLCGGILSFLGMAAFMNILSIVGISMLGGILHNAGQLFAAGIMLGSGAVFYLFPVLIISGIILGFATGTVCRIVLKRLP